MMFRGLRWASPGAGRRRLAPAPWRQTSPDDDPLATACHGGVDERPRCRGGASAVASRCAGGPDEARRLRGGGEDGGDARQGIARAYVVRDCVVWLDVTS